MQCSHCYADHQEQGRGSHPGWGAGGRDTAVLLAKPPGMSSGFSFSPPSSARPPEVVQTQPCNPPNCFTPRQTGTRGGAFTWIPLPLGARSSLQKLWFIHCKSGSLAALWCDLQTRVQCLCIPAHSGAGLSDQRLSLAARSALPASLPWVLQSELQTAEPFRFPQGSSERGWGHGVRLQSQPVRQKPGKVKISQHLF